MSKLDNATFVTVVRHAPLVSIDLVLRDETGCVLLGLRRNPPAQHSWFVPGGRIRKNETLRAATCRLSLEETGWEAALDAASFVGVYEHLYTENAFGVPGFGTHYVVLAYAWSVHRHAIPGNLEQHSALRWWTAADLLAAADVHPYTQAYLRNEPTNGGPARP